MGKAVFGIIGVGGIAQSQHLPNLSRAPHARLKTACDLRGDVLRAMQEKYRIPVVVGDYRELLADPEIQAVVVATREDMQAPLAIECLKAGKHVYVEKPLAETVEACEAVVAAQQKSGKFVAVDFNRRFAPAYRRASELAWGDGGPKNVHYRISDTYCRGWGRKCPPGVRVVHEVCHVFDLLRWLTRSEVASIYSVESRHDDEIFTLTFTSGCVASITSSGYVTMDLPKERLEAISEQGTAIVEEFVELRAFGFPGAEPVERFAGHSHPDYEYSHKHLFAKVGAEALYGMRRTAWELSRLADDSAPDQDERQRFIEGGQMWNYMVDKGWLAALDHFAECVLTGETPQNATARDGLEASRLAHAAIRSRETGEIVRL
ncbi:MAG TPA: Gfo/Idh/MocA family oxidoreductase [Planctomycetota bacterium]|nr:Gfo/Idh/MocA family oxidoreductase [Planctomycetota bacterium]